MKGPDPLLTLQLWLESTQLSHFMVWSAWAWPAAECVHFLGLALLLGTVGLFDLRLLGVGREVAIESFEPLVRWGLLGFALCFATGVLFIFGIPGGYMHNPAFRLKLIFLAAAGINVGVFYLTVAERTRETAAEQMAPLLARVVAGLSLFLWIAILCAGRMIAFYKP
jgi:hypothetical protein